MPALRQPQSLSACAPSKLPSDCHQTIASRLPSGLCCRGKSCLVPLSQILDESTTIVVTSKKTCVVIRRNERTTARDEHRSAGFSVQKEKLCLITVVPQHSLQALQRVSGRHLRRLLRSVG